MRLSRPASADTWIRLGLILAVAAVYLQTTGHGFINFDDQTYIYLNPVVLQGLTWNGVRWAFTTYWGCNWHPLTWLSHMADISLFGPSPGACHLVNAALHALNSVLVFQVFRCMTGARWRSALVAALFALHPAHVESVAWIAERKDLLSTALLLGALLAYGDYARSGSRRALALAAGCHALSLMAKPTAVSLPILLLLMDHWPLDRLRGLTARGLGSRILEKWPFFMLSLGSCIMTLFAQRQALISLVHRPLLVRFLNASWSYMRYLGMALWPHKLIPFYPGMLPSEYLRLLTLGSVSLVILVLVTWLAIVQRNRRPWLVVGWLWFLVSLVPMIGLVQVGSQALADRYTYVPLLGPFATFAWGAAEAGAAWRVPARLQAAVAAALVTVLGALSWIQAGHWHSSETLFRYTVTVNPGNPMGLVNLGQALTNEDRHQEALDWLLEAQRRWPGWDLPDKVLGYIYINLGNRERALHFLALGLALTPTDTDMQYLAAKNLILEGRLEQAVLLLRRYLAMEPQRMAGTLAPGLERMQTQEVRLLLGLSCRKLHWTKEACRVLAEAAHTDPGDPQVQVNLGLALIEAGRPEEALEPLRRAAVQKPRWPEPHAGLAEALSSLGRTAEAGRERETAQTLKAPGHAQ